MLLQQPLRPVTIQALTGRNESVYSFHDDRRALRAVVQQQLHHFRLTGTDSHFVEAMLRKGLRARWSSIRAGAVFKTPAGEVEVILLDGDPEMPARAAAVVAHIQHVPLGVVPIGFATCF